MPIEAQSFCLSIIDCYEPEQIKVKQIQEEIEQIILKNQQKEGKDNSGDEGSDYSNEDPKETQQVQQTNQPNPVGECNGLF
jgi:cytosolic carboxypeptidase protein 2/3